MHSAAWRSVYDGQLQAQNPDIIGTWGWCSILVALLPLACDCCLQCSYTRPAQKMRLSDEGADIVHVYYHSDECAKDGVHLQDDRSAFSGFQCHTP